MINKETYKILSKPRKAALLTMWNALIWLPWMCGFGDFFEGVICLLLVVFTNTEIIHFKKTKILKRLN